jgi:hypothetical protein
VTAVAVASVLPVQAGIPGASTSLRISAKTSRSAAGLASADPQELKVTEHATTDAITDTGASGDSAATS